MLYDSASLLALCQTLSGRPANDAAMSDARWYTLLTEGQQHWFAALASFCPEALVGEPVQLVTDDGGYTYRLPLVDGEEVFPVGLAEVRDRRRGRLLLLGPEWADSTDLVPEGTRLRVPHGRSRTFADGPWIRYAAPPGVISAISEPTLQPVMARRLVAYHALWLWASRPPNPADPGYFAAMEQKAWMGDPHSTEGGLMAMLAYRYLGGDGGEGGDLGAWWMSSDYGP